MMEKGFEPQMIPTHMDENALGHNDCFNLLIEHTKDGIIIYSSGIKCLEPEIKEYLESHKPKDLDVSFYMLTDQVGDDSDEQ